MSKIGCLLAVETAEEVEGEIVIYIPDGRCLRPSIWPLILPRLPERSICFLLSASPSKEKADPTCRHSRDLTAASVMTVTHVSFAPLRPTMPIVRAVAPIPHPVRSCRAKTTRQSQHVCARSQGKGRSRHRFCIRRHTAKCGLARGLQCSRQIPRSLAQFLSQLLCMPPRVLTSVVEFYAHESTDARPQKSCGVFVVLVE